jgi:hypothetical protein
MAFRICVAALLIYQLPLKESGGWQIDKSINRCIFVNDQPMQKYLVTHCNFQRIHFIVIFPDFNYSWDKTGR